MPTLNFKGKSVIETYHHTVAHHTLEFDAKLSVLGKGEKPSLDGNLIIEGDNLLALKALLPTHAGRVKCVYIDPPYNTGEEKWVYNDNLTSPQFKDWIGKEVGKEADDASRHDKWCCMMYPRLQLLRQLLAEDGALFVSIDDNEAGTLRLLLDEIFRVEKPLATLVWKRRSPTGMRSDPISVDHEYVLLYARNPDKVQLRGLLMTEADYPLKDEKGRYASTDLTIGMSKEDRPNQYYDIVNPTTRTRYKANPDRVWRFEPSEMKRVIEERLIIWPDEQPDQKMTRPRFKTRFDPKNPKIKPISSWIASNKRKDVEEDDEGDIQTIASGLNAEGGRALARIFGSKVFEYPKPPSLIRSLVTFAAGDDELVLDSFAGSGTTGQAILEANAADGKRRKFILVQMEYDNIEQKLEKRDICRSVTVPRIKAVMKGYSTGNGKPTRTAGLGGSFSYAHMGEPLFGEYKNFGKKLPAWVVLAKYIFYTETSREADPKQFDEESGFIGEFDGVSYYLLYAPKDEENRAFDLKTLERLKKTDTNRGWVVYCECIWMHMDQLREFEREHGKRIRPMLVPFNVK